MSKQIQDTSANNAAADYNPSKFCGVDADSNYQSTVTIGEGHIVTKSGGSDLSYQESAGAGGAELL